MNELERLQQAIDRQYAARPVAHFGALFIGSRDYRLFEAWSIRLEALRVNWLICAKVESSAITPLGQSCNIPSPGTITVIYVERT